MLAKGGILTPSYLSTILTAVRKSGNKHLHLGSRQDILFSVHKNELSTLEEAFAAINTEYIVQGQKKLTPQNIVSSYVSADIMPATQWVSSGSYLLVLENFNFCPKLRVNITDPKQSLVPLFYGNLNFIASPIKDFWFLYIRKNENHEPERWPVLVLSKEIGRLAEYIEKKWNSLNDISIVDLFNLAQYEISYTQRLIEQNLITNKTYLPDYEGFGKMYNSNNIWIGFYWRNNNYDVPFLEEICNLCHQTGISKISLTPWKTFLIKDIKEDDLLLWHKLLGRYGINMRHSSFDLNWHLPLKDKLALRLKQFIVKNFDKVDVSVNGLTFGINTKPEFAFTTIQIVRKPLLKLLKGFDFFATYTIKYAKNFDVNTCIYEEFMSQVPRHRLPETLQSLTLKFYSQMIRQNEQIKSKTIINKPESFLVYQCKNCLSIYNEHVEKMAFKDLPENFSCFLCDAPKNEFKPVYFNQLIKNANA